MVARIPTLLVLGISLISSVAIAQASESDGENLRNAARRGDRDEVVKLLDQGIDVNAPSEYGVTPLAMACDHGQLAVVQTLLERGADANAKDTFYKFTPLGWATMRKHPAIVEALLKSGAKDAEATLGSAVGMQQPEIVKVLLDHGNIDEEGRIKALLPILKARKPDADPSSTQESPLAKIEQMLRTSLSESGIASLETKLKESEASDQLKAFEGVYKSDASTLTLRVAEGTLVAVESDPDRPMPLSRDAASDRFSARGVEVNFQRDNERIVGLSWKVGETERRFQRTNDQAPATPPSATSELTSATQSFEDFRLETEHWPQFRGMMGRGFGLGAAPPTTWNGSEGINVAWKTPIPGLGTSSPVVWGNRIFITTAVQESDQGGFRTGPYGDVESVESSGECSYRLICLDRESGNLLWEKEAARQIPAVKRHAKSSHANPTPATDGRHVLAFFGEAGLHCYDLEGSLLWSRNLGALDSGWFYDRSYQWGFGSSPCIFEDTVYVQCDVQDEPFIAALDIETGEFRWRTSRTEIPTWSSPIAFTAKDGTPMVIATGTKTTAAYHARTGECLWTMGGFSEIVVPTPQVLPELSVLTSGYAPVQPLLALRHTARGELKIPESPPADSPFLWAQMRGGPYMPTPIVTSDRILVLDNGGILTGIDLATGKRLFRQRLRGEKATAYTASPVASGSHLYCTSEEGLTYVVAMDEKGTVIAQNDLGEAVLASPAIANGKIFLRGEKHLYCIAESSGAPANEAATKE